MPCVSPNEGIECVFHTCIVPRIEWDITLFNTKLRTADPALVHLLSAKMNKSNEGVEKPQFSQKVRVRHPLRTGRVFLRLGAE